MTKRYPTPANPTDPSPSTPRMCHEICYVLLLDISHYMLTGCRAFADSKTLTEKKRDALLADIMADSAMGYAFDSLSAQTISAKMLQRHEPTHAWFAPLCSFCILSPSSY